MVRDHPRSQNIAQLGNCFFVNTIFLESWQNGYCTSLENWRPNGLGGSNPSLSAMYFVYILYSETHQRFYVGQTNNIEKRIARHNSGNVISTKFYRPWKLIYNESVSTREEAMRLEKWYKSGAGLKKRKELLIASRENGTS